MADSLTLEQFLARLRLVRERLMQRHGAIERSAALYGFDQAYEAAQRQYFRHEHRAPAPAFSDVFESALMQARCAPFDATARERARDVLIDAFLEELPR